VITRPGSLAPGYEDDYHVQMFRRTPVTVLAVWSQAGPNLTLEPGQLLESPQARQELVFIGVDLDLDEPRRRLEPALLTDEEFAAGPGHWRTLEDPLPEWDLADLHEHA